MKKYLLSILSIITLFGFCSAVDINLTGDFGVYHLTSDSYSTRYNFPSNYSFYIIDYSFGSSNGIGGYCASSSDNCLFSPTSIVNSFTKDTLGSLYRTLVNLTGTCSSSCRFTVYQGSTMDIIYFNPNSSGTPSCPDCPSCPSTGEILSGYVPSSLLNECESDLLSCESNTSGFNSLLNTCSSNLNACNTSLSSCLQNNCPEITGLVNWSELKINDIVHQSAPFINITIPEEFDWNYTVDENEFDLSVSGYNVDTEYIDGIIRLQNTKPSNSDFNKIVSELLPAFVPGLVIILFIYFIFRFVKKIF